MRSSSFEVTQR